MRQININGRTREVDADPATPLLYVLRNDLELNGAKFGCGLGQCGACTVLVDGEAVFSCLTPLAALDGRAVPTVEGLGTPDEPGPLQQAFVDEQAAQCGYCIAGMIMRAQALLERTRTFSERSCASTCSPTCAGAARTCASCARFAAPPPPCALPKSRPCARRPAMTTLAPSRRQLVAGGGALVVSVSLGATSSAWRKLRRRRPTPPLPGSLKGAPILDSLDPHRRGWSRHGVYRQGRARPGHQDGADAGRRRRARRCDAAHQARHRRYGDARPTRATPPAASRCPTVRPRSATPRHRCGKSCWRVRPSG